MSLQSLGTSLALSLAITLAVELPLAWLLGIRKSKGLTLVFLANIATNPALVFTVFILVTKLAVFPSRALIYFLEVLVLLFEAFLYGNTKGMLLPEAEFIPAKKLSFDRFKAALLMSLILNLASYCAGRFYTVLLS